jgi:hypothetical protein
MMKADYERKRAAAAAQAAGKGDDRSEKRQKQSHSSQQHHASDSEGHQRRRERSDREQGSGRSQYRERQHSSHTDGGYGSTGQGQGQQQGFAFGSAPTTSGHQQYILGLGSNGGVPGLGHSTGSQGVPPGTSSAKSDHAAASVGGGSVGSLGQWMQGGDRDAGQRVEELQAELVREREANASLQQRMAAVGVCTLHLNEYCLYYCFSTCRCSTSGPKASCMLSTPGTMAERVSSLQQVALAMGVSP